MSDAPGGAAQMRATAPFAFRYQYLAGGVNTGGGWATWTADGRFVTAYVDESRAAGVIPVFTYYMLRQSAPGKDMEEVAGVKANLSSTSTMAAYFEDLRLFFQRAAGSGSVVLHVEPDLWGYLQQRSSKDDAATVKIEVGATGLAEVSGLPDTAAGFAQAIVRLRNTYAPNVLLGFHYSPWATGTDLLRSDPSDPTVDDLGSRTARFYRSTGARFDLAFTDLADRDAGFKQYQWGDAGTWLDADDFRRSALFITAFTRTAGIRTVLWQIPFGNTRMRAMDNTWNHYQDNKVEWLLDEPARTHLVAYANAGVVALLFGRGADGATCACDANGDGVTNPSPINGNGQTSYSADDDGGFFINRAVAYYGGGSVPAA